ncbi:dimethylargininase [Nocardia sp. NPDC088792]|uniref:dimethylargininase n=1 Tax=Nocardia sp. NPDC088792 TaxID=3364332 RepID=UPI003812BB35
MPPTTAEGEFVDGRRIRVAQPLRFIMCRPDHFEVSYAINPWMDPGAPVDRRAAVRQWERLRDTYREYGHTVETVAGVAGLPDMVFAANAGICVGDKVMVARFTHPERQGETVAYANWFRAAGYRRIVQAAEENEGEGDFLIAGDIMLGGTGFRTSPASHQEVTRFFGLPVIPLELADPRFYHLDTALCVLDASTVAYYPPAFSTASTTLLHRLFPDAIIATDADAAAFGLNAVSDGRHVFLPAAARHLHAALRERGFHPVGIDLSELLKAGGSVKCCTLVRH